jgi:hypothetical protein
MQAVSVHVGVPRGTCSAAHADAGDPRPPPDAAGPHFRDEAAAGRPPGSSCVAASKANDLSSLRKGVSGLPILVRRPDLRSTEAVPVVRMKQSLADSLDPAAATSRLNKLPSVSLYSGKFGRNPLLPPIFPQVCTFIRVWDLEYGIR